MLSTAWGAISLPELSALTMLGAVTFFGCMMRAFSGFGAGLLMAPVFSLVLPPTDVVVIVLLLNLLTTIQMLPGALSRVDWPLVIRIFLPSLLGLPVGLAMLHLVDAAVMRRLVGTVVALAALLMLGGWYYRGRRGKLQDSITGALSGFMTAIGGIGGPPVILYLLSIPNIAPSVLRAVFLVFFSLVQIATLVPLAAVGHVGMQQAVYILVLLPVAVVASLVGAALHKWAMGKPQERFRQACLTLLLSIGILTFLL